MLPVLGAPQVAVISSSRSLGVYDAVDCGGYVATLLTVAKSPGLSTIAQGAIAMHADVVHELLQIPEDRAVVCATYLGYADPVHSANGFRTDRAVVSAAVVGLPGSVDVSAS